MKFSIVLVLLVISVMLSGCESVKGVVGTVRDGINNQPLQNATVELMACSVSDCEQVFSSQATDAVGRYNFSDIPAGNYFLSIIWSDSPPCPQIQPFETMGSLDDFTVAYVGYGGIGGYGQTRMIATRQFELADGGGLKANLEFTCP